MTGVLRGIGLAVAGPVGPRARTDPGGPGRARPHPRTPLTRWARRPETTAMSALVVLIGTFWSLRPAEFATAANARSLAQDAAVLLVLGVAITYVTVMGSFDLSIGSVLVFSQVVGVLAMGRLGGGGAGTIAAGLATSLAAGTAWGLLNGALVARLRINPFIVTLGTLQAALGAARLLTDGGDVTTVPDGLTGAIGIGRLLGVPTLVWIAVAVSVAGGLVLAATRFGRRTYTVGSDAESARRLGVPVVAHTIRVYALAGLLSGLAGWLTAARFGTTSLGGHQTDALLAITAAVLGGASLYGGSGTVLGTAIGTLIPVVLANGLIIVGLPTDWQDIAIAVVLLGAVYLDRRRRIARRLSRQP